MVTQPKATARGRRMQVSRQTVFRGRTTAKLARLRLPVLRSANRLLAARYGSPRLGNPGEPISDLIFIVLSARTRGTEHEAAYRRLRRQFTWGALRSARLPGIERVI